MGQFGVRSPDGHTLSGAPPSPQRLPIESESGRSSAPRVPTIVSRGSISTGRSVHSACAAPGLTVSRKGEPGRMASFWRKPMCSRYVPAAPTE